MTIWVFFLWPYRREYDFRSLPRWDPSLLGRGVSTLIGFGLLDIPASIPTSPPPKLRTSTPGQHLHQTHRHHSNGLHVFAIPARSSQPGVCEARAREGPSFVMFDSSSSVRSMAFGASLVAGHAEPGSLPDSRLPDLAISRCWRTCCSHTPRRPMVPTPSDIGSLRLSPWRLHRRSTRAMIRCRRPSKTSPTTSRRLCVLRRVHGNLRVAVDPCSSRYHDDSVLRSPD